MKITKEIIENEQLPRDRATLNAWCRSLHCFYPVVNFAIEFHTSSMVDNFKLQKVNNSRVDDVFEKTWNILELKSAFQEYWTIGEVFPYLNLDESAGNWEKMIIQNPDYIVVKKDIFGENPVIYLRPHGNLRRLIRKKNPSPEEKQQLARLDPDLIKCVENGENIPLDSYYVSHLGIFKSPYDLRGTSMLVPVLVHIQTHGTDEIVKQILCYPHGKVSLDVLRIRFQQAAKVFKDWAEQKVLKKISEINDFYEYKDGKKSLIIPDIKFDAEKAIQSVKEQCDM